MSRSGARQVKPKAYRLNVNLVTVYNPIMNLQTVIRNNLRILYSDPEMKNIFSEFILFSIYLTLARNLCN